MGRVLEHPPAPQRLRRHPAGRVRGRLPSAPIGSHRGRLKPISRVSTEPSAVHSSTWAPIPRPRSPTVPTCRRSIAIEPTPPIALAAMPSGRSPIEHRSRSGRSRRSSAASAIRVWRPSGGSIEPLASWMLPVLRLPSTRLGAQQGEPGVVSRPAAVGSPAKETNGSGDPPSLLISSAACSPWSTVQRSRLLCSVGDPGSKAEVSVVADANCSPVALGAPGGPLRRPHPFVAGTPRAGRTGRRACRSAARPRSEPGM